MVLVGLDGRVNVYKDLPAQFLVVGVVQWMRPFLRRRLWPLCLMASVLVSGWFVLMFSREKTCTPNLPAGSFNLVRASNSTLYVYMDNDGVSTALSGGGHAFDEVAQIIGVLKEQRQHGRPPRFVDVGANVGALSVPIAAAGYEVHSFEAMEQNLLLLRSSICANKLHNLRLHSHGLGSVEQACNILSSSSNVGDGITACNATYMQQLLAEGCKPRGQFSMKRLDHVLRGDIDVLKVDVEGYEEHVLLGASELLAERRVHAILIEFWATTPAHVLHNLMQMYNASLLGFRKQASSFRDIRARIQRDHIVNVYLWLRE